MRLDERKKSILEAVIKDYVKTAEPVGSRTIVKKHNLKISPATVRNEMADLEEMGFLEQPHTSAGRIPSETGFRYFVDFLMVKEHLTAEEEAYLSQVFSRKLEDLSALIQKTGQVLTQLTNYAAVVISPSATQVKFKHMQLLPLVPGQALLVLVTDVGTVVHKKLEISESIRAEDLEAVSRLFNANLPGTQLGDFSRTALTALRNELVHRRILVERALEAIELAIAEGEDSQVFVSGALNILEQPEFKDFEKIKKVLIALEEHDFTRSLLSETAHQEVRIKIGNENETEDIKELSLVFTAYDLDGRDCGRIGVIGPVRMEYWRASGTVERVRELAQEVINRIMKKG